MVKMTTQKLLLSFSCCILSLFYAHSVVLKINTIHIWSEVSQRFQSVSIDANAIANDFKLINFSSPKLHALCRGLQGNALRAETFLRIGGGTEDFIVYKPNGEDVYGATIYTLNNTEWDILNRFANKLKWRLVFGLNVLTVRKLDGSWDPSNAIELLRYSESKGYVVQYELGNEPLHFKKKANITVSPEQLARDFELLKVILQMEARGEPMVIGPDVSCIKKGLGYLQRFLSAIKPGTLDAISYHFYYSRSEGITAANFTDPTYLDIFLTRALMAKLVINSLPSMRNIPVWVGETSSTSGGGQKLLGMSYAAGFLYLDKLGVAAKLNVSVVIKQALVGGWYSLLDRLTFDPSPSYWITLLHKQIVGRKVLSIKIVYPQDRYLRVYAHCANALGGRGYDASDIVVIAINLNINISVPLVFEEQLKATEVDQYLLTPGNGEITDKTIKLNGKLLKMITPTTLPQLKPLKVEPPLELPALSYAFYVLRGANAKACLGNEITE